MTSNPTKEQLVEIVKSLGQEVIDRAEDLVGEGDMLTDIDIWLRVPIPMDEIPTVEVTRSHSSKNSIKALMDD